MKTIENREQKVKRLMKKAQAHPDGSVKHSRIVMQICRLYDPMRFPEPDNNLVEVEF